MIKKIENRKARHLYIIEDTYEAGIVLQGNEVKSVREGRVNMSDAYANINDNGELFLYNLHISPYSKATAYVADPKRPRKLLMHRREINKLKNLVERKGYTLVPLMLYFNSRNYLKVKIGLARGKRKVDKREAIKERDMKRAQDMEMKKYDR